MNWRDYVAIFLGSVLAGAGRAIGSWIVEHRREVAEQQAYGDGADRCALCGRPSGDAPPA